MRTIIIDEADALFGQITNIFDSPTRTIIGMVNDLGIGADLQLIINAFNELKNKYEDAVERLNILEEKLQNFDGDKALVKINQVVMVDASISDMSEFMGYGAWELYGRGRFPFCAGSILDEKGKAKTIQVGEVGGEAFVALKAENNGPHKHLFNIGTMMVGRKNLEFSPLGPYAGDVGLETKESGEGKPHNNMPPFIAMQFWKRVG